MHLEFTNQTSSRINIIPLKRYLGLAFKLMSKRLNTYCPPGVTVKDLSLSVFFIDDKKIQTMNRKYRGKNKPTDVITFSYVENRDFMPHIPGEIFPAGEIFLSMDTIRKQAEAKRIRLGDELAYMLIHGFLHTFGYDHQHDEEEREMEFASYRILGKVYPRKDEFGF